MPEFFTITLVIILSAISPGPDFVLVVKNALQYNRRSAIFTALGVSCSLFIHSIYSILGLALIIFESLLLFTIIKYIGALYLIYIGIKSLLTKRKEFLEIKTRASHQNRTALHSFREGLLCNLLNPKAIMFILAFFTLIIHPNTSWLKQVGYCLEISLIHFIWFVLLSLMITHQKIIKNLNKIEYYIIKGMGIVLIGFGASIAITG